MIKYCLIFAWLVCIATGSSAQSYSGLGAAYGAFVRGGDWADTYGNSQVVSGRAEHRFANRITLALSADVFFGQDVLIDPLSSLRTAEGSILGDLRAQATPANTVLKARGQRYSVLAGYQLPVGDAGWSLRGAVGPSYLVHFIRIQEDATLNASNLREDYKRGYDRRAGGWGGMAELGAQVTLADGGFIVYGVATVALAQTSALRSTQFDLQAPAPVDGTDASFGVRLGVMLALLRNTSAREADEIYY